MRFPQNSARVFSRSFPRKLVARSLALILGCAAATSLSGAPGQPAVKRPAASSAVAPQIAPAPVATLADKPLSERVVAYQIDAKFDPGKHTLDATEVLTYRNLTGQPQDTFPFHLYLNAFQPTSTWIKEGKREGTRDQDFGTWDKKNFGS